MKSFSISGSKWWKCDFHNHTPASSDYGKGVNQAVLKTSTPRKWLLDYMAAEIDCVGITDHNSGDWIDKLKAELLIMDVEQPEGYRPIKIFPGVEITVNGGIHVLAIFDPSKSTQDISALLGSVGYPISEAGNSEGTTEKSIYGVIDSIIAAGGIAIPAHVDKACGLFDKLGGSNTVRNLLLKENLLAIEVVNKDYAMPDTYMQHRERLNLAEIVGSDSHLPEQVGTAYTWVKMEEPCIEALKLAFHDGFDGIIRHEVPNVKPNKIDDRYFIRKVIVRNGYKAGNGNPLVIDFSPWQSTLIGGRGSGKSSIINFLRIALDKCEGVPAKIKADIDNFKREGSRGGVGMLKPATEIDVEIQKDGRLLTLKWKYQTNDCILHELKDEGIWEELGPITNTSKLFPVRIFNQKELYELTESPNHLLELIDSQFNKHEWLQTLSDLEKSWFATWRRYREVKSQLEKETELRESYNSVNAKIKVYESFGNELLTKYKSEQDVYKEFKDHINKSKQLSNDLRACIEAILLPSLSSQEWGLDEILANGVNTYNQVVEDSINNFKIYAEALKVAAVNLDNSLEDSVWYQNTQKTKIDYDALIESLNATQTGNNIDYPTLLNQKKAIETNLDRFTKLKEEKETLVGSINSQYDTIILHHRQLRTLRKEVINTWSAQFDNETIAVYLHELGDFSNSEQTFRDIIRRSGEEFKNDILTLNENDHPSGGFINDIINSDEMEVRWQLLRQKKNEMISATETDSKGIGLRFIKHIQKIKETTPEDIDKILLWVPEDRIVLKLKRQGREEDIEGGSAGQRTAAILSLLLSIDNVPLILDQPEDDLDSRMVTTLIVERFKKLKPHRQIVVVTHNPNIAVNASSETIVELAFNSGQIRTGCYGALQKIDVRSAVCEIMEGGKTALETRYYRISKALSNN
ncbi:TrlF family AAA-like ATPase [Pontibacter chitinilyticus]|uniref:TrlF family AAA-like ATPase n=1 Tax=Pontibacter chitinilyticus TaxID=2674989 RepID=UPI00321AE037